MDEYLKKVDVEIRLNLNSGVLGDRAKAELKYSSDFSMQDHLGGIFSSLKKFLEPLVQSPWLAAILIASLAFIVLIFALIDAQTFIAGAFDKLNKAILELVKMHVCPWLNIKCN